MKESKCVIKRFHFLLPLFYEKQVRSLAQKQNLSRSRLIKLILEKSIYQLDELESTGMAAASSSWMPIDCESCEETELKEVRADLGECYFRLKGHHHLGNTFSMAIVLRRFIVQFLVLAASLDFDGALRYLENMEQLWLKKRSKINKVVHLVPRRGKNIVKYVKYDYFLRLLETKYP